MKKNKHNGEILKSIVGKYMGLAGFPIIKIEGINATYRKGLSGPEAQAKVTTCDLKINSNTQCRRDK